MNNTKKVIQTIVTNAILIALTVVFTIISNYIQIFPNVSLNLSLVTIALAAIIFGYKSALVVGLINGLIVMISAGVFFAENPIATVFICLLKSSLAGLVSALLFKLIKKANGHVAIFVSCLVVPLINTGLFVLGVYLFFPYNFFIIYLPSSLNVIIEVATSVILTPMVYYIIKIFKSKKII